MRWSTRGSGGALMRGLLARRGHRRAGGWRRRSLSFVWTPYDVAALDIASKLQPPSAAHWLGTDHFGRDVLSMLMVGARVSIAVALVAVGIGMAARRAARARGGGRGAARSSTR